jgi:hypothetical protein
MTLGGRTFQAVTAAVAVLTLTGGGARAQAPATAAPAASWLAEAKSPEDYVLDTFRDHDIVFIGETHYVKQNLDFLQGLIPRLHAAGIYNLGFEFTTHKEQAKVDAILSAPVYDEAAVHDLFLDWYGVNWGFHEYADVYRTVWTLNRSLPRGARPFRIVALDALRRVTSPSQIRPGEKPGDPRILNRILGGHFRDATNIYWNTVITTEFINKDEKALIYCGSGHSYTKFFRQRARDNGLAAGNLVFNNIGPRVFRIGMHNSEAPAVSVAVEKAIAAASPTWPRIGFDVARSPVGAAVATGVQGYLYGHPEHCGDFTVADILDGYIFLAPVSAFRPVRLIPGFVTPRNLAAAQSRLMVTRPNETPPTLEEIERKRREDFEKEYAQVVRPLPQ